MRHRSIAMNHRPIFFFCLNFLFLGGFSNPADVKRTKYTEIGIAHDNSQILEQTIVSIENRLKNLDNLYNSQLAPTIEMRLQQYQTRMSGLETKMLRLEALFHTKLDRMADNISSRHFRDDMIQTDIFRKLETAYDGLANRLTYMERKLETNFAKIQGKNELVMKKVEKIYDDLTSNKADLENELTNSAETMEELKNIIIKVESKVLTETKEHLNVTSKRLLTLMNENDKFIKAHVTNTTLELEKNVKLYLRTLSEQINEQFPNKNPTDASADKFQELNVVLNDYANKISDMNEERLAFEKNIDFNLELLSSAVNSTKVENHNGIRALMIQVGKINKENTQSEVLDRQLAEINKKLSTNFAKVISSQNTFLESCYRVQMDEKQMETEIGEILEKLIDNFSNTSKKHYHQLKKIEALITMDNDQTKNNLHQIHTNIKSLHEKSNMEGKQLQDLMKTSNTHMEALFSLVQNTLSSSNQDYSIRHPRKTRSLHKDLHCLLEDIYKGIKNGHNVIAKQNLNILQNTENISNTAKQLIDKTNSIQISLNTLPENIEDTVNKGINRSMDQLSQLNFTINKYFTEFQESLSKIEHKTENINNGSEKNGSNNINNSSINIPEDTMKLINEIFLSTNSSTEPEQNCLDLDIDVRFNQNKSNSYQKFIYCQNLTENQISNENTKDKILFNETSSTIKTDLKIDVRFKDVEKLSTENATLDSLNVIEQNGDHKIQDI